MLYGWKQTRDMAAVIILESIQLFFDDNGRINGKLLLFREIYIIANGITIRKANQVTMGHVLQFTGL